MSSVDAWLPIDPDAEQAVLSAVLTSPEAYLDVTDILTPTDFGLEGNAAMMRAAMVLDASGKPIDVVTIADELRRAKELKKAGGTDRIQELADHAVEVGNVRAHAQIVADKSRLRRLLVAGRGIAGESMAPAADADEVLASAEARIFEIGGQRGASTMTTMAQAVPAALADLARARSSVLSGVSTGIPDLDRMTGGLSGGQLIVIAARPAMGKSAFATQVARHIADTTGKAVPLLSYEMSTTEITLRLLAASLDYDTQRLRQGDIPQGMEPDLAARAQELAACTLMIDDNPPETIGGVRSMMRRLASRAEVGAIVVDYLQLMSGEGKSRDENRTQEVSEISRGLKRLSTEIGVPVIACAQLNRGLEARPNKRPMLSDLRDSGAIEQDASLVLFIHREIVYNAAADPEACELIIAKHRGGTTGIIHARFFGAATKFVPAAGTPTGSNGRQSSQGSSDPWVTGGSRKATNPF